MTVCRPKAWDPFCRLTQMSPGSFASSFPGWFVSQPGTPRGNIPPALFLPPQAMVTWAIQKPGHLVWARAGKRGYSTLPALGQFFVPGECSLIPDSLLPVPLPPSSMRAGGEKSLVPRTVKLKANILLLFDWFISQLCPIKSQSPRLWTNINQQPSPFIQVTSNDVIINK